MRMTDKNTFSGRDIREYKCDACGHDDWEDRGKALWQILSDDREEFEAAKPLVKPPPIQTLWLIPRNPNRARQFPAGAGFSPG